MEQRQITGLTSRPELNGAVVEILGRDASTGRLRVRVVGQPQLGAMALKRENLTQLSWANTAKQAFGRLDVNELRQNARFFWSKPAAKVALAVLALAILSSRRLRFAAGGPAELLSSSAWSRSTNRSRASFSSVSALAGSSSR